MRRYCWGNPTNVNFNVSFGYDIDESLASYVGAIMSELILPDSVASQLQGFSGVVHLCDSSGKRIGSFVPRFDPSDWEIEPELSVEELRNIEQSSEWYSTEQVLRHLEKLA